MRETLKIVDKPLRRFAFELGIVPHLYFVVRKCRHHETRRKALSMLALCLRQESFPESTHFHTVAKRSMEIEEAVYDLLSGNPLSTDELPPEKERIHHFVYDPGHSTPHLHCVSFLTKPLGVDKPWHILTELVDVGSITVLPSSINYPGAPTLDISPPTAVNRSSMSLSGIVEDAEFNDEDGVDVDFSPYPITSSPGSVGSAGLPLERQSGQKISATWQTTLPANRNF